MVAKKKAKSTKGKTSKAKAKKTKAKTLKAKTAKAKKAVASKAKAVKAKAAKVKTKKAKAKKTKKVKTAKAKVATRRKAKTVTKASASKSRVSAPAQTSQPASKSAATSASKAAPVRASTKPAAPSKPQAASGFQAVGTNDKALFTLKLHRGDGMTLIAMNWKNGEPSPDFVGFAIEYQEPGDSKFWALNNRLGFLDASGNVNPQTLSTLQSPIQKFRWVHFPLNANLDGDFIYRVTPMFMDPQNNLSKGEAQQVAIQLARETYPGVANVTFTRGFASSQAFVDHYGKDGDIGTLVAPLAAKGLDFKPTHPDTAKALPWMGFEARQAILDVLDEAIDDKAKGDTQVRVVAYDFNLPDIVDRLVTLGDSVKIIIDDSKGHGGEGTAETEAEGRLIASAGRNNVLRQHMGDLQHNKTIAVKGPTVQKVVCGSTNLSWRGFYVQANNALVLTGETPVDLFFRAFDAYFTPDHNNNVAGFDAGPSADWNDLKLPGIDAKVTFSPHSASNAKLTEVANDIKSATSSVLYSLAFLYETPGAVHDAIAAVTADKNIFVYGISDREVHGGLDVQDPSGNVAPVYAAQLSANVPEPFKSEPSGGKGTRMHHKFTVIDFDKPTARVYLGSYNFSNPADRKNGENLVIIRDRRIAVSYMIEALSLFDHYSFRVAMNKAKDKNVKLHLLRPPRAAGEKPWWEDDYTVEYKIKDRLLFS